MPIPRFYCPPPISPGERIRLPEAVARHALGALRMRRADYMILFDGSGDEVLARLDMEGRHAVAEPIERRAVARESPLEVILAQGISSGERMDYTVQKAVELGVSRIEPLLMRRTPIRLDAERRQRRHRHWQAVAIAACEQCGRNRIPQVDPILEFDAWLTQRPRTGANYLLDPEGTVRLNTLPAPDGPACLLTGPEGGFDAAERAAALAHGFLPLRLGPRILRTETAAVAALAAMQALWGDL